MALLLVVDDLLPNRLLITRLAENFGHQTLEASDGVEALALVRDRSPDLILMDIAMPNMDGYEAARQIKAAGGDAYLPIIFVTAASAENSLADATAAGGDDFISQPVSAGVLESKISAHLRIRQLNQRLATQNRELDLHNRRLRQETELIEHFFDKALHRSYSQPEKITCYTSPASAFNGDLILIERGPAGQIYVLIGDFTGHGLQAAMGTLPVQQAFFELCQQGVPLANLVEKINHHLAQGLPESMFFAATVLCFDASYKQLEGWFGGMPPAMLLDDQGAVLLELPSMHMPLGILDDAEFDSELACHPLPAGSRLYLFSDGAAERKNPQGEPMGATGLRQLLQQTAAVDRFNALSSQLTAPAAGQQDDISFIEIKL